MATAEPSAPELVLGEVLGEGGAARVYAASWRGRDVCAKVAHTAGDTTLAAEAAAACAVDHPALAPVLGSGALADGRAYLVMPRLAWYRDMTAPRKIRGAVVHPRCHVSDRVGSRRWRVERVLDHPRAPGATGGRPPIHCWSSR
jgi:hypothetical protein